MKRICLWSGPRNVSTALMYSFAQRSDTKVADEPLYGHYLRVSGMKHPGYQEVLDAQNTDGNAVLADLMSYAERPVFFIKHMAHHLVDVDRSFLADTVNVLLVRDPEQMLPSLINQIPTPNLRDTGLAIQADLFRELQNLGQMPAVLDAKATLLNPEGVLKKLCQHIGLRFDPAMLQWQAGALEEDGVWAPHWYHNVHKSTGFQEYTEKTDPFPEELRLLLAECKPHYEFLLDKAI
ncbi:MAG: sulfotransferase family protein [Calditrichia bacterium]